MAHSDQAKYYIAQLELIRIQLYHLAKHVVTCTPKVAKAIGTYADELKDWREVLEEHISDEFDIGKQPYEDRK